MKEEEQLCDYCNKSRAILYCRADSASLCISCDRHVHHANTVSSKHSRSLLCNSCFSASSSILCTTHNEVLCSNCDFEAHVSMSHHERRPVESFCGCPSANELVLLLGLSGNEDLSKKKEKEEVLNEAGWVWDVPHVVRLNDLIVPVSSSVQHEFQVMDVPPLPKDRNLACGKYKEEILHQLHDLINSESDNGEEYEPVTEFQSQLPHNSDQENMFYSDFDKHADLTVTPDFEAGELQWNNDDWQEATDPTIFPYDQQLENFSMEDPFQGKDENAYSTVDVSNGYTEHNTVGGGTLPPLTTKIGLEILCPDRDSVISRYKEKRKARRYDKLIRYESRKARADSRLRIKGRFAKIDQAPKS